MTRDEAVECLIRAGRAKIAAQTVRREAEEAYTARPSSATRAKHRRAREEEIETERGIYLALSYLLAAVPDTGEPAHAQDPLPE